jgi:hypothetical protein
VSKWVFAFTRENLLNEPNAYGTEVQAGLRNGIPDRLIAGGWTPNGKFGAEYYLVNGRVVFVYESRERFRELSQPGWRNFRGNSAWERRIYLTNGRIAYVETTGFGAPDPSAKEIEAIVARLLKSIS